MITINKEIRINNGEAPFTYNWSTDQTCISFDSISGTVSEIGGIIETNITFNSEQCTGTVTLTVTDANNCVSTQDLNLNNPCESLSIKPVTNSNGLTFSTFAEGGSGNYSYNWNWDDAYFNLKPNTDENNSILDLTNTNFPGNNVTSNIYVTATDNVTGCEITIAYTYNFCSPVIPKKVIYLQCNSDGSYTTPFTELDIQSTCNPLDYSTLEFSNNPAVSTEIVGSTVKFTVSTPSTENISIAYQIADIYGILSNTQTITLVVPDTPCPETSAPVLADQNVQVCYSNPVLFNIQDFLFSESILDFNTINLNTAFTTGTVTSAVNGIITYTPPTTGNQNTDHFSFTVADTDGLVSSTTNIFIDLQCEQCTTIPDIDYLLECNTADQVFSPFESVTIPNLNPNTLSIPTQPTNGSATVSGQNIIYSPGLDDSTDTSITYQYSTFENTVCTGVINIAFTVCCDLNALEFNCSQTANLDEVCITATPVLPGVTSYSTDNGVTYTTGTEFCTPINCVETVTSISNEVGTTDDFNITIDAIPGYYLFSFTNLNSPTTVANNLCTGLLGITISNNAVINSLYLKTEGISNITTTADSIFFQYDTQANISANGCKSTIESRVNATNQWLANNGNLYNDAVSEINFNCLTYSSNTINSIIFKHEVPECDCVGYTVTFNPQLGCSTLQVTPSGVACEQCTLVNSFTFNNPSMTIQYDQQDPFVGTDIQFILGTFVSQPDLQTIVTHLQNGGTAVFKSSGNVWSFSSPNPSDVFPSLDTRITLINPQPGCDNGYTNSPFFTQIISEITIELWEV